MAYRDDFFTSDNIVGYTGDLNNNPTVYFETQTEHGRITQDHGHENNIGRNEVKLKELFVWQGNECTLYEYNATNQTYHGVLKLFERYESPDGASFMFKHRSRNQYITNITPQQRAILEAAITNFPFKKNKSGMNDLPDNVYVPMGDFAIYHADRR